MRLGEALVRSHAIEPEALVSALELQKKTGSRLGAVLAARGWIAPRQLYRALAAQHNLQLINLARTPPDPNALNAERLEDYLRLRLIPWRNDLSGRMTLAVTELNEEVQAFAARYYPNGVKFVFTTPRDLVLSLEERFGALMEQHSRFALYLKYPHWSARFLWAKPKLSGFVLLALMVLGIYMLPSGMLATGIVALATGFYLATLLFKILLLWMGTLHPVRNSEVKLEESSLPVYTILVPLYREWRVLPQLLGNLRALDYPKDKLDIKLICEADDAPTIEAIKQEKPEAMFELIRVPASELRTKPKACNYALRFARGEYVTIYDAEDRPDPRQLKKAVARFRASPEIGCLQASLNYDNAGANLLTRLFALEYALWFDLLLPALEWMKLPIPLGGTSNHLNLARLRELGEWDSYNVTEDADLGIRLAAAGFPSRMLASRTMEEAPATVLSWIRQRSRWIKGYIQTWIVHMRDPMGLYRRLGLAGFMGFQFFIGAPALVFLISPFMWIAAIAWSMDLFGAGSLQLPFWLKAAAVYTLSLGFIVQLGSAAAAASKRGWRLTGPAVPFFPFYWLLHSLAAFKAVWQLAVKPHFWEKTEHFGVPLAGRDLTGGEKAVRNALP